MAAQHLGRTHCPECGFGSAHVRQNEGKHPYRWCPECGANYPTRNARQRADLLAKTRPEGSAPAPAQEPAPAPGQAPTPAPAPAPRRGLFESIMGGGE